MRAFSFSVTALGLAAYGLLGVFMVVIAAVTWEDVPPVITTIGGIIIIWQACVKGYQWVQRRGVDRHYWKKTRRELWGDKGDSEQ